jgi:hypothetical protein
MWSSSTHELTPPRDGQRDSIPQQQAFQIGTPPKAADRIGIDTLCERHAASSATAGSTTVGESMVIVTAGIVKQLITKGVHTMTCGR